MKKLLVIAAVATIATIASSATSVQAATTKASKPGLKSSASLSEATGSTTPTATTKSPVSAAVGNSTLTTDAEKEAKAGKKWSASVVSLVEVGAADANYSNANDKSAKATNYAGIGYKINANNALGFRQYFTLDHKYTAGKGATDTTTMNDPAATYSHNFGKLLGSKDVTTLFWYYAPVSDASKALDSSGKFRIDAEVEWVLTPKWSVSYYFNPRQTMIQDQMTLVENKPKLTFSTTRLIHYGILYYNFTDATQAYTFGGFNHLWRTSAASLVDESGLVGIGMNFTFFKGGLILNPEINSEMATVKDGFNVADNAGIQEANITYALTAAVTF